MNKKPTKAQCPHGEDCLATLEKVGIVLESGQRVFFDIHKEIHDYPAGYPAKPSDVLDAAQTAVERFAFWAYQTERVLANVRAAERSLARARAMSDDVVRNECAKQAKCGQIPYISEALVEAALAKLPDVIAAEEGLDDLRKQYGMARAVRDAVEHRLYVLRSMLRNEAKPQ